MSWATRRSTWERWFARVALAPTCYGHFFIEHNRGASRAGSDA